MKETDISQSTPKTGDLLVVFTAGIGLFLSTLDSGMINIALPTLSQTFHSSLTTMAWTVTLYSLTLTGTIIIFGRLSDRFGRLRIYSLGLILFSVASVCCGFSRTAGQLIAFRALQGIGAAMLQATAIAIITTTIPEKRRSTALASLAVIMGIGPVLGPSIGGVIISLGGWPWMFWINLPIAAAGLVGCRSLSVVITEKHSSIELHIKGNLLLSFSILCLLQGFSTWSSTGFFSPWTYGSFGAFIVLFLGFVVYELHVKFPIIDLRLFRKGAFTAPILAIFIFGGATSIGFIVPPYFLERVACLEPWKAGLVNLFGPLGLVLCSSVSARLIPHWGNTRMMLKGMFAMFISYIVLGQMQANWSPWVIAAFMFLYGLGGGLFLTPNMKSIMESVGQEIQGTIGAVQRMVQNLGIAIYTAIAIVLIPGHSSTGTADLLAGLQRSWDFAALSILAGILVFLGNRRNSKSS
ncbi:EmrB/QacA subfamily drug resistance transporter [Paenibacillus favisporus]|uniref:EmrB/QacA subfamily drug resistance transporter n=1 Tax=Paenibacillus favisporus TaxID=221028 RepID=A0ABV2EZ86_9BACL